MAKLLNVPINPNAELKRKSKIVGNPETSALETGFKKRMRIQSKGAAKRLEVSFCDT